MKRFAVPRLILYDRQGRSRALDRPVLAAARLAKARAPRTRSPDSGLLAKALCAETVRRALGLDPVRLEAGFAGGRRVSLAVPDDLGNFIGDVGDIMVANQYSAPDLHGRAVVDAGANIGIFSLYACLRGARRVYAFEPVGETFDLLCRNILASGLGRRVVPVHAALGRAQGTARIHCNTRGEGSARLSPMSAAAGRRLGYEAVRETAVLSLDGFIREKVGFIKIDTEGCERQVLLGARAILRRDKPLLSFAAYHRKGDLLALPRTVLNIRKDYRITLNAFAERDFYCE